MTYQKGIAIGNQLINLGQEVSDTVDKANARQDEADYESYLGMLQKGENPEEIANVQGPPQEQTVGQKIQAGLGIKQRAHNEINQKALMRAHKDMYAQKIQDVEFRKAKLGYEVTQAQKVKADVAMVWDQYNGALRAGNSGQADELAVQIYNQYPNGETLDYDRETGKVYEMDEDEEGNLVRGKETKLPPREQISELMKGIMAKGKFEESFVAQVQKNEVYNWQQKMDAEKVVNSKGAHVGYMAKVINPRTGKPDWQYSPNGTKDSVSWEAAKQQGLQTQSRYLGVDKVKSDIAETKSKTRKRDAEVHGAGIPKPQSSAGKNAADMVANGMFPDTPAGNKAAYEFALKMDKMKFDDPEDQAAWMAENLPKSMDEQYAEVDEQGAVPDVARPDKPMPKGGIGDADVEMTETEQKIEQVEGLVKNLIRQVEDKKKGKDAAAKEYYEALVKQKVDRDTAKEMVMAKFGKL